MLIVYSRVSDVIPSLGRKNHQDLAYYGVWYVLHIIDLSA